MRNLFPALLACVLCGLFVPTPNACAQGTQITYQGRLDSSGVPANGSNDLTFTLYNAASGGATVGMSNVFNDLLISNGLFTVTLDFGAGAFDGAARYLELAVRPGASTGAYTNLTPRQAVTAAPYAVFAGGVSAAGVTGPLPATALSGTYGGVVNFTNAANVFAGDGGRLTNLNTTNFVGIVACNPANQTVPLSHVMDFSAITNGGTPGQPFLSAGSLFYPLFSSLGSSNQTFVTNGYLTLDTRTVSNSSTYLCLTSAIPVRRIILKYRVFPLNVAGEVGPQFTILISSNSFGSSGTVGLSLTSGLHIPVDANVATVQLITGGIGPNLGTVAWDSGSPMNPADNIERTLTVEIDKLNSRVTFLGDNLNGTVTDAAIDAMLPWDTNTLHVGWQFFNAGTTNLKHRVEFSAVGVENRAASDLTVIDWSAAASKGQLNKSNYWRGNNVFGTYIAANNSFESFGSSAGFSMDDRGNAANSQRVGIFRSGANTYLYDFTYGSQWLWHRGTGNYTDPPFFAGTSNGMMNFGSPTNRFGTGYVNNVEVSNIWASSIVSMNYLHTHALVNVATNPNAVSNLSLAATSPGMVEYWITNSFTFTNFTGFAGTSGSKLLKFHPALVTRTNLFPLGKQYGVNFTTNDANTLCQTFTNGNGYNVELKWFGTNIDVVSFTRFSE